MEKKNLYYIGYDIGGVRILFKHNVTSALILIRSSLPWEVGQFGLEENKLRMRDVVSAKPKDEDEEEKNLRGSNRIQVLKI